MKRLISVLLLLPAIALGAANDILMNQRNSLDTGTLSRTVQVPTGGQNGILGFNGASVLPQFFLFGQGLSLSAGTLSAPAPDWSAIPGKPSFSPVATSGAYSDLSGRPSLFSGAYSDLTGVPSSFAPSPHTHAASDITSGTLSSARIPQLSIAQTSGLQGALDAKLASPSGTTAQYLRGDGSLATFPAIPAPQVQTDWSATSGLSSIANKPTLAPVATAGTYSSLTGIPTTFPPSAHSQAWSTITATPTTLAGYGVTDGVTQAALTSAIGSYATTNTLTAGLATKFNQPTGTTAQYVRGDGSLATLPVARRIETYTGTTNASGQITVTYPTAFPVAPVVQPPAPALANQVWTTVASTTTGFTMQLNQRNTVTLLSIEVLLGATVPVNGTAATFLVVAQ